MFILKMGFLACTLLATTLTGVAAYRFFTVLLVQTDGSMPAFRDTIVWGIIREAGLDWQVLAAAIFTLLFFILFLAAHILLTKEQQEARAITLT